MGKSLNIIEPNLAEEQLKILNDLMNIAPASITVHDFAGRFLYANQKTFDLHGYSPEEFFSLKLQDIDVPASKELIASRMERIQQDGEASFEVGHFRRDGSILPLWVHVKLGKWGNEQVLFSIATDMTEQKRREAELKRIGRLLAETEAITRVGGWEYETATGRITWTDEVYRIHGVGREYDPNNVKRSISFYESGDQALIEKHFRAAVEVGEPYDLELRFIRADGEPIWVRTIGKPVMENGKVVRVMGNIMDITDRKTAAEELRESEERFRLLVENAPEGVFIQTEGRFAYLNNSALRMFGAPSAEELCGQSIMTRFHPDYHAVIRERVRLLNEGRQEVPPMEQKYLKLDGTHFDVDVSAVPFLYKNRHGALVFFRDITERKKTEAALKESELRFRELSIVDSLTQLNNSRQFYIQLQMEIDRVNRYDSFLTLVLFDIDNFKAFNDAYGHVEGDKVLMRVGQVVKRCLRKTDSAYRYGGEEFTILLPMTKKEDGILTAERIRAEFKKENFSPAPGQKVNMTISLGIDQYRPQEDMKTYVHRVDQLMYQAKKDGKDRVCADFVS